jgi:hypothetical protein
MNFLAIYSIFHIRILGVLRSLLFIGSIDWRVWFQCKIIPFCIVSYRDMYSIYTKKIFQKL